MSHVNTWHGGEVIAAYTAEDGEVPAGAIIGRQGNAVLIRNGDEVHIVSRPFSEGDILDVIPGASAAPETDLSGYF